MGLFMNGGHFDAIVFRIFKKTGVYHIYQQKGGFLRKEIETVSLNGSSGPKQQLFALVMTLGP